MNREDSVVSSAPFATTHWSVVLTAGRKECPQASEALEHLCRTYWYPLYAFVRRQGRTAEEAQDLTQGFFARLLEKDYLRLADPARGRFRTFLITGLKAFLAEAHRHATRLKRGGREPRVSWDDPAVEERFRAEARVDATPETLYEERWALTVLESALARLREELVADGRAPLFDVLEDQLWGDPGAASYAELSTRLGMSEGAVKVAMHRWRRRFRELLRREVAETVADIADIDGELRYLVTVVRRATP